MIQLVGYRSKTSEKVPLLQDSNKSTDTEWYGKKLKAMYESNRAARGVVK